MKQKARATAEDTIEAAERYETIKKIERSVEASSSGPFIINNFTGHSVTVQVPTVKSKKRGRG